MRPAPDHASPANAHYAEYDGSGQMLREYGWKPGSLWGTDPAYFSTRNQELETRNLYYYLTDHLGTPHSLIDSAGATVWSASYDTFGQATIQIGSVIANGVRQSRGGSDIENNLRFPGQYFDPESGLHYNFHRYYSPTTGRYNRLDPIKDSTNWYRYVDNNPIFLIDTYGLLSSFAICNRGINYGSDMLTNLGIFTLNNIVKTTRHTYISYIRVPFAEEGWGITAGIKGDLPQAEKTFNPLDCKTCTRNAGNNATDDQIKQCIMNTRLSKDYNWHNPNKDFYVCWNWTEDAVKACGLTCK